MQIDVGLLESESSKQAPFVFMSTSETKCEVGPNVIAMAPHSYIAEQTSFNHEREESYTNGRSGSRYSDFANFGVAILLRLRE